jgi:hypothetical protein
MARPEYFGSGDDSELNKAFWDVISGVDVEVESAIGEGDADFPKLWMGNTYAAADSLAGETFRQEMLRAISGNEGESILATQALRRQLHNPSARVQPGSKVAFRGLGVVLAPPSEQRMAFREVCLDGSLFVIGRLKDALFDQYWHLTTRRVRPDGGGRGNNQPVAWIKELRLGPVAVLEAALLYRVGGSLVGNPFPQLRVPLAEASLQPLKVHPAA